MRNWLRWEVWLAVYACGMTCESAVLTEKHFYQPVPALPTCCDIYLFNNLIMYPVAYLYRRNFGRARQKKLQKRWKEKNQKDG